MWRLHFLTVLLMSVVLIALVATALFGGGDRAGAEVRAGRTAANLPVGQATDTSTPTDTATPNFIYTPTDTSTPDPTGLPTSTPFPTPPQPSPTIGPSATPTPRMGCASSFEILEYVPSASAGRFNQLEAIDAISE